MSNFLTAVLFCNNRYNRLVLPNSKSLPQLITTNHYELIDHKNRQLEGELPENANWENIYKLQQVRIIWCLLHWLVQERLGSSGEAGTAQTKR